MYNIHYIQRSKGSSGKTYIYDHMSFGTSTDLVQLYFVKMTTLCSTYCSFHACVL